MCECNSQNFFVDLPHLENYTTMVKFKIKEQYIGCVTSFSGGVHVRWGDQSQKELARIYEECNGGTTFIEKSEKSNEESKSKPKKKSSSDKRDDEKE